MKKKAQFDFSMEEVIRWAYGILIFVALTFAVVLLVKLLNYKVLHQSVNNVLESRAAYHYI